MGSLTGQDPGRERRRRTGWHRLFAVVGVVMVVVGFGIVGGAFYLHEISDEGSGSADAARIVSGFIAMGGAGVVLVGGVILVLTLAGAVVATVRGSRWTDGHTGLVSATSRAGHQVERTWIQPGIWRRVPALRCTRCGSIWFGEGPIEVGGCGDGSNALDSQREVVGVSGRWPARR